VSLNKQRRESTAEYRPLLEQQLATIKAMGREKASNFFEKEDRAVFGCARKTTLQRDSGPALSALFAMAALVLFESPARTWRIFFSHKRGAPAGICHSKRHWGRGAAGFMRQVMAESCFALSQEARLGLVIGAGLWTF